MREAGPAGEYRAHRAKLPEVGREMIPKPQQPAADWLPEVELPANPDPNDDQIVGASWPDPLAPEAYHGIVGEWVRSNRRQKQIRPRSWFRC
jgi:hypothetical protein